MRMTLVVLMLVLLGLSAMACSSSPQKQIQRSMDFYGLYPHGLSVIIAGSKVIARVRFVSVEPVGVYSPFNRKGYHPSLEVSFKVLEYIKGTGGSTLTALIYKHDARLLLGLSQNEARDIARTELLPARDSRWDDREAMVFLRYDEPTERLWLGRLHPEEPTIDVTVVSSQYKAWLPAVATGNLSTRTRTPSVDQLFYLDDPGQGQPGGGVGARSVTQSPSPSAPTISLGQVKSKVADILRWVRESGGTPEAEECVLEALGMTRSFEQGYKTIGPFLEHHVAPSGQPAGSIALSYVPESVPRDPEGDTGRLWNEGRDGHLFGDKRGGWATFARPLPAGEYRYFHNFGSSKWIPCDFHPEEYINKWEYHVTVEAPAGTLAESFFDPYADGAAVTGTTTVGTISWQSRRVAADLTVDVTGHVLDFIGLDGTVVVSLVVADTSESAGALTWAVPVQPWSAGDKLMLRVRKATAGEQIGPRATSTPVNG